MALQALSQSAQSGANASRLWPQGHFAGRAPSLAPPLASAQPRVSSERCQAGVAGLAGACSAAPRHLRGTAFLSLTRDGPSRAAVTVCSAAATATVELLGRELTAEESGCWQASCDALHAGLGLDAQESSQLLAKAFGWKTQAFWRREKVEEVPTPGQVTDALAFLGGDLAMSAEEQLRVVRAFPEVLACDVEIRLRANAAQLQSQWRLQGSTLTKAVLRQPQILGYSVDCGGDCIGECNRCWVRF